MRTCETCERIATRDAGTAPLWDTIYRTAYWDIVHSYNTALPGWLVIVARRHLEAIDGLTDAEAAELGVLVRRTSLALKEITGCIKTYVVQFAEAAEHPHVHFHVIPRMADQPDNRRGPQIFGYLGVAEAARVSEARMNDIARRVQTHLQAGPSRTA